MHYEKQQTVRAIEGDWFPRWTSSKDALGKPSSSLELLIIGALRYLGKGWTFDDCEESTAINEETYRVVFHEFIQIVVPSSAGVVNKYFSLLNF
jgi:hypothetical protein